MSFHGRKEDERLWQWRSRHLWYRVRRRLKSVRGVLMEDPK